MFNDGLFYVRSVLRCDAWVNRTFGDGRIAGEYCASLTVPAVVRKGHATDGRIIVGRADAWKLIQNPHYDPEGIEGISRPLDPLVEPMSPDEA